MEAAAFLRDLDHAFLMVKDLAASAERYRKLGFNLSPRGLHGGNMGTANHCIALQSSYFELVGIVAPTEENASHRIHATQGGKLKGIAFRVPDAGAAWAARRRLGLPCEAPMSLERSVPALGGDAAARFRLIGDLADQAIFGGMLFGCQHLSPQMVWHPPWMLHPNGARDMRALWILATDLEQAAAQLAGIGGASSVRRDEDLAVCALGNASICVTGEAGWRQRFPKLELAAEQDIPGIAACQFQVQDLPRMQGILMQAEGGCHDQGDSLWTRAHPHQGPWLGFASQ